MHAVERGVRVGRFMVGVLTCAALILPELSVFSWSVLADVVMLVYLLLSVVCEKYPVFSCAVLGQQQGKRAVAVARACVPACVRCDSPPEALVYPACVGVWLCPRLYPVT